MPDSILVAVDGSVAAQNAADIAIQIARNENLGVKGVYIVDEALVLDPYSDYQHELGRDDGPASRQELIEKFENKGGLILEQLRSRCRQVDVDVETQILFGGVLELVLDRAKKCDLLSIGRRGNEHAGELNTLGRHFLHIAHQVDIPVIIGGEISRTVKRLFLIYRGRTRAEPVIDWTIRLQRTLDADLTVAVFDHTDQGEDLEDARRYLEERGVEDYSIIDQRPTSSSQLAATLFESQADLILMHGYRHSEFFNKLFGSFNDEVLLQSQLPILMV